MDEEVARHLRGIDRTLRYATTGVLAGALAWLLRDILLLGFAAVLMACVLRGASDALDRSTAIGPRLSLAAVLVLGALSIGSVLWWRGNAIADQGTQIAEQLKTQFERLWQELQASSGGALVGQQLREVTTLARAAITGYVPGIASSVLGVGGSIILTVATAVFLAASPQTYLSGSLRLLPLSLRPRGREIAIEVGTALQLWFVGQLADMVVVAILVGAGLFLLDVSLAPTLALLAGLLNFVPYVGALAGAVPAVLVALAQSPALAMWVGVLFISVQVLEGNVIAPLIQRRAISMAPALTIISQTILGSLFGILGLVVATSLTAALLTTVRMAYVEGILERESNQRSSAADLPPKCSEHGRLCP